jgi:hypothetical protein
MGRREEANEMSFEDQDPLAIVAGVVNTARARLTALVPPPARSYDTYGTNVAIEDRAGRELSDVFAAWDRALAAIDAAHAPLQDSWLMLELTQAARINRGQAIIDAVARTVSAELAKASAAAKSLVAYLEQAVLPPRPLPIDATQEGQLANLRGDLRLVLDHAPADDVPEAMIRELEQLVAADDALGIWFMAGDSTWPNTYCRARGVDLELYSCRVADALSASSGASEPDDGEKARAILTALKGPKGLIGGLIAMGNLATWRFEGLGGFAPGATTETDFTVELPA